MANRHIRNFFNGRRDQFLVALCGVALMALTGYVFLDYSSDSWRFYQAEFRSVVAEKLGPEKAASLQGGLKQVYIPELERSDRCVTCHLGIEWSGLESVENPYKSHPKEILKKHPIARFGCTLCHAGQGHSVDFETAHGPVEHWEEPLLGSEMADFYAVGNKMAMMQIQCNICHRYDKETKGADYINRAKTLVNEKGCRACHVINGRGGTVGPDLNRVGNKSPESFNYERIRGAHTAFTWHVSHFKNPKETVAETVMPSFGFSSADAQALALLVMSWKKSELPIEYLPGANYRDVPTPEEIEKEERMSKGPGAIFVKKQCFICQGASTLGIDAAAQIGPDLAIAVTDVQSRFGKTLEDFLANPTGTMSVVLTTMINLTPEERAEVIDKLKHAYALKENPVAAGSER